MVVIRFNRSGRTNSPFFRIVVTESSKPTQSGFIKIVGWYNPHTKESSINKEEILRYLNNGAQVSNSVAKLLEANKISHKAIKFVPDTAKAKKSESKEDKPAPKAVPETSEESADNTVEASDQEDVVTEATAENTEAKTPAEETANEETKEDPRSRDAKNPIYDCCWGKRKGVWKGLSSQIWRRGFRSDGITGIQKSSQCIVLFRTSSRTCHRLCFSFQSIGSPSA